MRTLAATLALTLLPTLPLRASGPEAPLDTVTLDALNVVAIKQQDRLAEQPVAATVLGHNELQELNIVALHGISDIVPNLYMPEYGSRVTSSIYVRGIGARIDQPSVGLVVDNVPVLNKNAYDFDLADIASVEMLRGPQSTLFGRNTMSGLINISTVSPLRHLTTLMSYEGGSHMRHRGRLALNLPVAKNFGLGVAANYSDTRGEYANMYNSSETDRERQWGARLKAEWQVRPRVRLVNTFSATQLRQSGYPYAFIETGDIAYNDTCYYRRTSIMDALTVRHTRGSYSFTSVSSVQYLSDNLTLDQDFLPQDYFTLTQRQHETGVTQDMVWRGLDNGGRYNWLAGVFGFWKRLHMQAPVTFKDTGIAELIEKHRNESNPGYPIRWDTRRFVLDSDFTIPSWGLAAYHESTLRLGRWTLSAALRLDYERTSMTYRSHCDTGYKIYGPEGQLYRHVPVVIDDRGHMSRHHLTLLPKVGAVCSLGSVGNLYASVAKGFKSGGYNTQMFSDVLQQRLMNVMGIGSSYNIDDVVGYRPEKSWNYEVGAHLSPVSSLGVDAALFWIDCRDQQLTVFPDGSTTGRMMANAGRTRSVGAELSARWQPLACLGLSASYGLTNARFVRYNDGINDYARKRLPYVPANTLFVQGVYRLALRDKYVQGFMFDVNMRGTGNIYWNEANTRRQRFYALLGAQVTMQAFDCWEYSIWARNLTGTRNDTFYFVSMGHEFVQRAKTLEVGATIAIRFNS